MAVGITVGLAAEAGAGGIVYVDGDAGPNGDGGAWETAFQFLQDALSTAGSGTVIRVAEGTYCPDRFAADPDGTGSQQDTFDLSNGVILEGGYAGLGAMDPDERDIDLYVTTLSGDLAGDDGPDFTNVADNSWHVIRATSVDNTARLDGFTITAGNAVGPGGDPTYDAGGGGMNLRHADPVIVSCRFVGNRCNGAGGAVTLLLESEATLEGCAFAGNVAGDGETSGWGGAILIQSDATITGCSFDDNAARLGGALEIEGADPTITDCQFTGNAAKRGGAIRIFETGDATDLVGCTFQSNSATLDSEGFGGQGGAIEIVLSSPAITDCLFTENMSTVRGGAIRNDFSSPTITRCTFTQNSSDGGGAMASGNNVDDGPTLIGCKLLNNHAEALGGAIITVFGARTRAINSLFCGNHAGTLGGALYTQGGATTETNNCTIVHNSAAGVGGGLCVSGGGSELLVGNCIVSGNEAPASPQIGVLNGAGSTVTYTLVQGGWSGEGNIDGDPDFVDVAAESCADNDYHLGADSDAIDAGSNDLVPIGIETDLDGDPRIVGGTVDMGAYERQPVCPADTDGSGSVDVLDLVNVILAWGPCPGCPEDIDDDGNVGVTDLVAVILNWGVCE